MRVILAGTSMGEDTCHLARSRMPMLWAPGSTVRAIYADRQAQQSRSDLAKAKVGGHAETVTEAVTTLA